MLILYKIHDLAIIIKNYDIHIDITVYGNKKRKNKSSYLKVKYNVFLSDALLACPVFI